MKMKTIKLTCITHVESDEEEKSINIILRARLLDYVRRRRNREAG